MKLTDARLEVTALKSCDSLKTFHKMQEGFNDILKLYEMNGVNNDRHAKFDILLGKFTTKIWYNGGINIHEVTDMIRELCPQVYVSEDFGYSIVIEDIKESDYPSEALCCCSTPIV